MHNITTILVDLVWFFLFVRSIVCLWMIFSKAWRHWWEALIPIWNVYVYFKIAGRKNWFWALFITPILWIIVSIAFWFIGNPNMYSVRADSLDLDSVEQSQEVYSWDDPWIAGNTEVALTNCWGRYDNCGYDYIQPKLTKFQVIKNKFQLQKIEFKANWSRLWKIS